MTTAAFLAQRVYGRLQAVSALPSGATPSIHYGKIPARPVGPYAVLYASGGVVSPLSLAAAHRQLRWTFNVVCAAYNPPDAIDVVEAVRNQLTGWRPVPEDRAVSPLNESPLDPPLLSDSASASDSRFSVTLTYSLIGPRS